MLARPFARLLSRGRHTVLAFHKVPLRAHPLVPDELAIPQFEAILAATQALFTIIPLDEAVRKLRAGTLTAGTASITFDDGYAEWAQGVAPVLRRHNAHATFFLTTGQFDGLPLWNERIFHAVLQAAESTPPYRLDDLGLAPLQFANAQQKVQSIALLEQSFKYLSLADRVSQLEALEAHTQSRLDDVPRMSLTDLRSLESQGFGIGAHSVTHPILARISEGAALQEMVGSKERLEHVLGCRVRAFAYPNGIAGRDFGHEHTKLAQRAGYEYAVTTVRGVADERTPVFQIPRFTPWGPSRSRMAFQLVRNLGHTAAYQEDPAPTKKALMVAFHFPPQAGSSGILRTLNFAKYLPLNGWQPFVLSAQPQAYVQVSDDLVDTLPSHVQVVRGFALDAARHLAIRQKYPGVFAIPDRWASWWLDACRKGLRVLKDERPSVIWSTYPISTAHLIGLTIARWSGLPWVADFRDPMLTDTHPEKGMQRHVWRWIEAATLRNARCCVFTTERAAQTYRERYPQQAAKCVVIENGYDEDAFAGNAPRRSGVGEGCILMLHSGIIYPGDRDPTAFFSAVQRLVATGAIDGSKLVIRFRAPHHADEVARLAALHGLSDQVDIAPPVSYREAISEMMGADLLMVFQGASFKAQVPAKIYEYLRTGNSVLGLVDLRGDTAAKLAEFRRIHLADIQDAESISQALERWLQSQDDADAAYNIERIRKSNSRVALTGKLAAVLDACSAPVHAAGRLTS